MDWTGNIRELRNMLVRLTLTEPERRLDAGAIEALAGSTSSRPEPARQQAAAQTAREPSLRDAVRSKIAAAYRETGGNLSETARRLGVSRNTIYRAIGKSPQAGALQ